MNVQVSQQQLLKAQAFKALHDRQGIFVIPNPWDAGSAKMLASLGYQPWPLPAPVTRFPKARLMAR